MKTLPAQYFTFAEFELDGTKRLLRKKGKPVVLNPKAFDLLLALVENRGEVLGRDELLERVWNGQFVEEGNLTVQISALRKLFGERKDEHRFIVTVPGRGYSFVAELNDETNGEIIVESHSLSRIVVEEEIEEENGRKGEKEKERASKHIFPSSFLLFSRSRVLVIVSVLVLGGAAWLYNSRNQGSNLPESLVKASERQLTARVFTTAGGIAERVAVSPDGKTLAYVERLKGQNSLRLGELETNNSVQIIPVSDRLYRYIAFTPDGKSIYFTARDSNHREPALMRVSIFGGAVQDLIPEVSSSFTFSPDGKSLAFLRKEADGNRTSLIIADAETGGDERVVLVRESAENMVVGGVSWSPDGQLIAFAAEDKKERGTSLLAVNTADNSIKKIGHTVANRIVNMLWMANGSGLIVNRNTTNNAKDGRIWFAPYPQGEMRPITNDTLNYSLFSLSASMDRKLAVVQSRSDPQIRLAPEGDLQKSVNTLGGTRSRAEGMFGLASAPDGKIVFTANVNDSRTIWEMDADGSNQRQLTTSQKDINDAQINVTPDNRFLIFDSNRTGRSEIWRANRDGSDLKALTSGGGNIQPAVSPDGLWVAYIALRDHKYELRRVSIEGGEPVQLTTEKSFWPAISPDGRFIAYAHGRSDANPNRVIIIIPFEGGAPLKTFDVPVKAVLYNRLRWSPDGKAIIYKDDLQGLWRQDLEKNEPEPVQSPDDLRIYHFAYSADRSLVYSGGIPMREIVILENFH